MFFSLPGFWDLWVLSCLHIILSLLCPPTWNGTLGVYVLGARWCGTWESHLSQFFLIRRTLKFNLVLLQIDILKESTLHIFSLVLLCSSGRYRRISFSPTSQGGDLESLHSCCYWGLCSLTLPLKGVSSTAEHPNVTLKDNWMMYLVQFIFLRIFYKANAKCFSLLSQLGNSPGLLLLGGYIAK